MYIVTGPVTNITDLLHATIQNTKKKLQLSFVNDPIFYLVIMLHPIQIAEVNLKIIQKCMSFNQEIISH